MKAGGRKPQITVAHVAGCNAVEGERRVDAIESDDEHVRLSTGGRRAIWIVLAADQPVENNVRVLHELRLDPRRSLETDFAQAVSMIPTVFFERTATDFRPSSPVYLLVVSMNTL